MHHSGQPEWGVSGRGREGWGRGKGKRCLVIEVCVVCCVCSVHLWSAEPLRQDGGKSLPLCSAALKDSWTHPLRPCSLSDTVVGYEYS